MSDPKPQEKQEKVVVVHKSKVGGVDTSVSHKPVPVKEWVEPLAPRAASEPHFRGDSELEFKKLQEQIEAERAALIEKPLLVKHRRKPSVDPAKAILFVASRNKTLTPEDIAAIQALGPGPLDEAFGLKPSKDTEGNKP